jgi:hypothetical protein
MVCSFQVSGLKYFAFISLMHGTCLSNVILLDLIAMIIYMLNHIPIKCIDTKQMETPEVNALNTICCTYDNLRGKTLLAACVFYFLILTINPNNSSIKLLYYSVRRQQRTYDKQTLTKIHNTNKIN